MKQLVDFICEKLAAVVETKSVEQLRELFKVKTPPVKQEIMEQLDEIIMDEMFDE